MSADQEYERLSVEQIIELNRDACAETGENHALLDRGGLEAAVERPWTGFGENEFYTTLYEKAGALLHGIAARQVFENGNKRTAWLGAVTTLDINGIDIGLVPTIQSDAFVRAVSVDHNFAEESAAEWFEVAHVLATGRRHSGSFGGVRVPVLFLANAAIETPPGLLDVVGGGWSVYNTAGMPGSVVGSLCGVLEVSESLREVPQAMGYLVRDQAGQELGFRASSLISATRGTARPRTVFAVPFSFVVFEPGSVTFEVTHEGTVVEALTVPIVVPLA